MRVVDGDKCDRNKEAIEDYPDIFTRPRPTVMLVVDCQQSSSSASKSTMPFVRRKRTLSAVLRNNEIEARGEAWLCFAKDHSWFQGNISTDDESNYSLYGEKRKERLDPVDELLTDQLIELGISSGISSGSEDGESSTASSNKERRDSGCSEATDISVESSVSDDGEENNNNNHKKVTNPGSKLVNSSSADEYYSVTLTDHFSGIRYQLPPIYINQEEEEKNLFVCADGQISFQVDKVFKGQKADMMIQQFIGSPSLLGQKCFVYHGPMSIIFSEAMMENARSWCL